MEAENEQCNGSRYNFKKGMEFCPNKEKCQAFSLYQSRARNWYDFPMRRFLKISDFRKCTEYKNQTPE